MDNNKKKLFVNKTAYTSEAYMEYLKFHDKKFSFAYKTYTLIWSVLLFVCIIISFDSKLRLQGVIITIILVSFIIFRLSRRTITMNKENKSGKIGNTSINTFEFYDKEFTISNKSGKFIYKYFMLYRIYEAPNYFYLYTSKENACLVLKTAFSLGSSDEFSKFLKNKCGYKYKALKK